MATNSAVLRAAAPAALTLTANLDHDQPIQSNWTGSVFDPLVCRDKPHSNEARLRQEYASNLSRGVPFPRWSSNNAYHSQVLPLPTKTLPICSKLKFTSALEGSFVDGGGFGNAGPRFQLDTCQLRGMSADQALSCLANKRVTWIGDSVTWYQSLSLAYWLANDKYQHPFDVVAPGGLPSITWSHASQRMFETNITTQLLSSGECYTRKEISGQCHDHNHNITGTGKHRCSFSYHFALRSGAEVNMDMLAVWLQSTTPPQQLTPSMHSNGPSAVARPMLLTSSS